MQALGLTRYPPVVAFQNPCGGKRWQILPSGLIEVEGEGIPTVEVGSSSFKLMQQTWENWGGAIMDAAGRNKVPTSWVLAVATMETGFLSADPKKQAAAVSPVGARGVMQIMPANTKMLELSNQDELFDPVKNINAGTLLLSKLNAKPENGGLPGVSALYNSGRLCTSDATRNEWMLLADANYPRRVIEWNNTAILTGMAMSISPAMLALLGAATGGALALAFLGARA